MKDILCLDRRGFLAANAAVAAATAVPSVAAALPEAVEGTAVPAVSRPIGWHNVDADDLAQMIGDRFRVRSETAGQIVMKLVAVEPGHSGAARPGDLPRREGVVAVFDSPDKAPLEGVDHAVHRVSHPRLGAADLFCGASPTRSGRYVIEMVLN